MFNKVYLGTTPIDKIYLGDTPIKYGSDIPENVVAIYTVNDPSNISPSYVQDQADDWTEKSRYKGDGIYTVTITASEPPSHIRFGLSSLLSIDYLDTSNMTDMTSMFKDCTNLVTVESSDWNTSKVTDMTYMFHKCEKLVSLDASRWNMSNVKNTRSMFSFCFNLRIVGDLSRWNTASLTNAEQMFSRCYSLPYIGDISGWNMSQVSNIEQLFYGCYCLTTLNISNWNTSNIRNMRFAFDGCKGLTSLDLSEWNTTNHDGIGMFNYMFQNCTELETLDIRNFYLNSSLTEGSMAYYTFYNCTSLHTIRMDNCNYYAISELIDSLPSDDIGKTRTIYCKESEIDRPYDGVVLSAPSGWTFSFVN